MILINYLASFFLIVLGLYCIVTKYDLMKSVIGLSIIDYGVNLLIITIGFNPGGTAPIFSFGEHVPVGALGFVSRKRAVLGPRVAMRPSQEKSSASGVGVNFTSRMAASVLYRE